MDNGQNGELETESKPRFECKGAGLYKYLKTGGLYWRPFVNGVRVWRALKATNIKLAREEMAELKKSAKAPQKPTQHTTDDNRNTPKPEGASKRPNFQKMAALLTRHIFGSPTRHFVEMFLALRLTG
jgi:hypothetical protein